MCEIREVYKFSPRVVDSGPRALSPRGFEGPYNFCVSMSVCLSPLLFGRLSKRGPNLVQPGLNLVQTMGRSLFIRPVGQCPSTTGTSILRLAVHTIPERFLIPGPDQRSASVHYKGAIAGASGGPLEHLRGLEGPVRAADHNILSVVVCRPLLFGLADPTTFPDKSCGNSKGEERTRRVRDEPQHGRLEGPLAPATTC